MMNQVADVSPDVSGAINTPLGTSSDLQVFAGTAGRSVLHRSRGGVLHPAGSQAGGRCAFGAVRAAGQSDCAVLLPQPRRQLRRRASMCCPSSSSCRARCWKMAHRGSWASGARSAADARPHTRGETTCIALPSRPRFGVGPWARHSPQRPSTVAACSDDDGDGGNGPSEPRSFNQIQRLGNPLISEVLSRQAEPPDARLHRPGGRRGADRRRGARLHHRPGQRGRPFGRLRQHARGRPAPRHADRADGQGPAEPQGGSPGCRWHRSRTGTAAASWRTTWWISRCSPCSATRSGPILTGLRARKPSPPTTSPAILRSSPRSPGSASRTDPDAERVAALAHRAVRRRGECGVCTGGPVATGGGGQHAPRPTEAEVVELDLAFYLARVARDSFAARDQAELARLYLQRARTSGAGAADLERAEAYARRSLALRGGEKRRGVPGAGGELDGPAPVRRSTYCRRAARRGRLRRPPDPRDAGRDPARAGRLRRRGPVVRHAVHRARRAGRGAALCALGRDPRPAGGGAAPVAAGARRSDDAACGCRSRSSPGTTGAWATSRSARDTWTKRERELGAGLTLAAEDHRLLDGLARLALARGRWREAIAFGERAIARTLDPATLGLSGDGQPGGRRHGARRRIRACDVGRRAGAVEPVPSGVESLPARPRAGCPGGAEPGRRPRSARGTTSTGGTCWPGRCIAPAATRRPARRWCARSRWEPGTRCSTSTRERSMRRWAGGSRRGGIWRWRSRSIRAGIRFSRTRPAILAAANVIPSEREGSLTRLRDRPARSLASLGMTGVAPFPKRASP